MQQTFAHVQASRLADRRYEGQLKSARKVRDIVPLLPLLPVSTKCLLRSPLNAGH